MFIVMPLLGLLNATMLCDRPLVAGRRTCVVKPRTAVQIRCIRGPTHSPTIGFRSGEGVHVWILVAEEFGRPGMVQEISKRPGVTEDNDTIPLPSLQLPALPSPQQGEGSEYLHKPRDILSWISQHMARNRWIRVK
jgi:hypothetical protein